MATYIARRLVHAVIVLVIVTIVVFVLTHLIPGGEARAVLGPRSTPQSIAQFNRVNGFDLPLWDQYWHLFDGYLHFRFGYSFKLNQPVGSLIAERLPKTLVLVGLALVLAVLIAIPLGMLQVARRNSLVDYAFTGGTFVLYSMPTFLLGPLLILLFALKLHWLSFEAPQGSTVLSILDDPRGLILPVVTLALISVASYSRYMRSSLMDAMMEDYIRTARAVGESESQVFLRHALRNALIPIVTLIGLSLPALVSGAFITESVFNYPGMGLLGVNAISDNDLPTLLGTVVIAAFATVIGSLLADVLYALLDPRIRYR
jgi:peptide/nickel transport system permease protein